MWNQGFGDLTRPRFGCVVWSGMPPLYLISLKFLGYFLHRKAVIDDRWFSQTTLLCLSRVHFGSVGWVFRISLWGLILAGWHATGNLLLGAFSDRSGWNKDVLKGFDQLREIRQSENHHASHFGLCLGYPVDAPGLLAQTTLELPGMIWMRKTPQDL